MLLLRFFLLLESVRCISGASERLDYKRLRAQRHCKYINIELGNILKYYELEFNLIRNLLFNSNRFFPQIDERWNGFVVAK